MRRRAPANGGGGDGREEATSGAERRRPRAAAIDAAAAGELAGELTPARRGDVAAERRESRALGLEEEDGGLGGGPGLGRGGRLRAPRAAAYGRRGLPHGRRGLAAGRRRDLSGGGGRVRPRRGRFLGFDLRNISGGVVYI